MGGFLLNGCGVADKFKKVKSLGVHVCPTCNKVSEFHLCEVQKKIHVLFIPAIPCSDTSYAVMCKRCGNGRGVTPQWAHRLVTGAAPEGALFEEEQQVVETTLVE